MFKMMLLPFLRCIFEEVKIQTEPGLNNVRVVPLAEACRRVEAERWTEKAQIEEHPGAFRRWLLWSISPRFLSFFSPIFHFSPARFIA